MRRSYTLSCGRGITPEPSVFVAQCTVILYYIIMIKSLFFPGPFIWEMDCIIFNPHFFTFLKFLIEICNRLKNVISIFRATCTKLHHFIIKPLANIVENRLFLTQ